MEKTTAAPLVLASGFLISFAVAVLFTVIAVGPRSFTEARRWWRAFNPSTPKAAEAVIRHIEELRRDPEIANMYFLSRFIVMVVLESVGQLLSGLLAVIPVIGDVPDRILSVPFAVVSLWLAAECLITYRRITTFESFRASLIRRVKARATGADAERLQVLEATPQRPAA
jgi:uncharacterized membrane protein